MTREQAKSELMQIYGALSSDKQIAIDTLLEQEPCDKPTHYGDSTEKCKSCEYKRNTCDDLEREYEKTKALFSKIVKDDDVISREAVKEALRNRTGESISECINAIPPINLIPCEDAIKCKNCKYFEYDSVAKVDGVPLIVAHEICNKWGDGCKTNEDGYCFLFEPQESEVKE